MLPADEEAFGRPFSFSSWLQVAVTFTPGRGVLPNASAALYQKRRTMPVEARG